MSEQRRGPVPAALKRFIWDIQSMVELEASEREIFLIGRDLMARLLAGGDVLPEAFTQPDTQSGAEGARQFQVYSDQQERFGVVASVLPGGHAAPIYQDPVWELAGVVRGAVTRQRFGLKEGQAPQAKGEARVLDRGSVDTGSPRSGDAVRLANALSDGVSVVIHVYGGEIGRLPRRVLAADGGVHDVVSGYANPEHAPAYDIYSIQTEIKD